MKYLSLFLILALTSACYSVERLKPKNIESEKLAKEVENYFESVEKGKFIVLPTFPTRQGLYLMNKYCDSSKPIDFMEKSNMVYCIKK